MGMEHEGALIPYKSLRAFNYDIVRSVHSVDFIALQRYSC